MYVVEVCAELAHSLTRLERATMRPGTWNILTVCVGIVWESVGIDRNIIAKDRRVWNWSWKRGGSFGGCGLWLRRKEDSKGEEVCVVVQAIWETTLSRGWVERIKLNNFSFQENPGFYFESNLVEMETSI